ncbi:MAG TPA: 3-dehydroquinate synthase [Candidatus Dormibacteraeota bacterium]
MRAPSRGYPVLVGAGAISELPGLLEPFAAVAVVRDAAVSAPAIEAPELVLEGGEGAKTWDRLREVVEFLESCGLRRDGCVVAVGGGSIGDLAGFAAAIWQRGIAVIQVPTTLLAMVDAAIGGKTAIDTAHGKNAVGAFWQPSGVIADLDHLGTLPEAQRRSGLAEVVKYAVAMDADLAGILERDAADTEPVIARCVELKAAVVAEDERETSGRRAILNYGHTAGHALEAASGYSVLHGQAVAFGMRVAARLAVALKLCGPEVVAAQDHLLQRCGLPGPLPAVNANAILEALPRDKKSSGGRVRWVLPRAIGRAEPGHDVPDGAVREVVEELAPS